MTEPALALATIPKEEVNAHGERLICFKSTIGSQGSVFLLMYCISDYCLYEQMSARQQQHTAPSTGTA